MHWLILRDLGRITNATNMAPFSYKEIKLTFSDIYLYYV